MVTYIAGAAVVWLSVIALSGTNFVKNRFIYEYYLGGDPSTYIADTALLPSINLARLMQITAGVLQFFH